MSQTTRSALLTDFYELTMAQGYFDHDRTSETATFELFYRSNPFDGGYAVLAGIKDAIDYLRSFSFTDSDVEFLRSQDQFSEEFLDYLTSLEFSGTVTGLPEGSVVFPYEPILQFTGPLILVQLVESALLNKVNYPTLIATKSARITYASRRQDTVLEFGLRRAQSDGAHVGARAAMIGGCVGTSNTFAGKTYQIPVSGTQAHSWIQSFPSELEAFRAYAKTFPNNTILLVDTYDTLESGIPNAIEVGKEMEENGFKLRGIRIDSGDLAWLAINAAKLLDKAGLDDVKIVLSSDLDEYVISSIVGQILSVDDPEERSFRSALLDRLLWGVGTNLITGSGGDKAALGGVYKLVEIQGQPVIKISENRAKTTNPGRKKLWRVKTGSGEWIADVMGLYGESIPETGDRIYHLSDPTKFLDLDDDLKVEDLHVDLMEFYPDDVDEVKVWKSARDRCTQLLGNEIDESHLRFLNPHIYKVSLTERLFQLKQEFLKKQ